MENWARRVALTGVIAITYILSGFLRVGGTVHTKESAMALCSAIAVARRFPPPLYRRVQASPLETFLTNLSLFADAAPDRPPPPSPSRPSPVQSTSHALYVHTTVSCSGNAASPDVPVGAHKPSFGRTNPRTNGVAIRMQAHDAACSPGPSCPARTPQTVTHVGLASVPR